MVEIKHCLQPIEPGPKKHLVFSKGDVNWRLCRMQYCRDQVCKPQDILNHTAILCLKCAVRVGLIW